jgi:M6 family metalloprotease-like protein
MTTPIFTLDLDKGWGDYFEQPKNKGNWRGWDPQQTGITAIVGAFCDMLDRTGQGLILDQMDAVVFVVQTATENLSVVGTKLALPMYVWPQATRSQFYRRTQHAGGPTTSTYVDKPIVFMPSHTPSKIPSTQKIQQVSHTNILCHELGHTLGCGDLYNSGDFSGEVAARTVGALDLMDNDSNLPHFSLPNRMRLGWIGANWIERFDFSVNSASKNVTLQAAETLKRTGPPPGRVAGIEIRVREGWNYYFEYRRQQPAPPAPQLPQIGDQSLTSISAAGQLVFGSDVIALGNTGMIAGGDTEVRRPRILALPVDADNDGPILDALGEDYEETDVTNPDAAHDFRLRFDGADPGDPNAARVRVEYVDSRRADLRIRPAPGNGNWKSQDIDLEGPKGMNTVATGLEHKIVIRVKNAGTEGARSVRVRVAWLPFTTTPGAWTQLPDPPRQDIAKGQTVEFRVPWTPQSVKVGGQIAEHFCVKAEVERYVDPSDPTHSEIVIGNNWAQSNFDTTEVAHGSPSERRTTGFSITNRLPRAATYLTAIDQDSALCRIYIGHAWLRLPPGEDAMVELGYESLAGDPIYGSSFDHEFETLARRPPPLLSLTSLVVPEEADNWISPRVVWGANLSIRIGRRTRVRIEGLFERVVRGTVTSTLDGRDDPVTRGRVNVVLWLADRPQEQFLCGDDVSATGRFDAVVPREIDDAARSGRPIFAEALYLGAWPWAASRSGARRLR